MYTPIMGESPGRIYTMIQCDFHKKRFPVMNARAQLVFSLALITLVSASNSVLAQDFASRFAVIDSVEYLIDENATPPDSSANWTTMSLPMGSRTGNEQTGSKAIWMRFELEKPNNPSQYSLYFHRYNLSIDVFLNEERIGGDTHREGRHTTSWNHPRLVEIQNASWNAQNNVVHVRFQASYFGGTFGQIVFGKTETLTPLWEDTLFKHVGINSWLQLVGILVTALAGILWLTRRQDTTYLLLAGMAISWTVLTTHMVVYYNLIEYRYWLPLVHLAMNIFVLLSFKLLSKLNSFENPRLDQLVLVWFATAVLWNQFGPYTYWWMGTYAVHAIGNLFLVYQFCRIIHKALFRKDRLAIAFSITLGVQLSLFAHDYLLILLASNAEWETGMYFSQFAFPLLLIVFAGILLERFRSALSLAESLNRELAAKVEASRQVIEKSYAERRQLELQQATEKERIAIYRDLHDDVGSKLLSIVHAGRDNKLGDLARGALESLRNAVSKANSEELQLADLLSSLLEETQLRLEGSGHTFSWNQPHNIPAVIIPADKVFNINQVFRELVSNIIRHANAGIVTIEVCTSSGLLIFDLADNGVGFSSSDVPGNGLNNVTERVSEIGGTITWAGTNAAGVNVKIEIPT